MCYVYVAFIVTPSNHPSTSSGRMGKNLGRLEHPLQPCPEQMLQATLFMIRPSATLSERSIGVRKAGRANGLNAVSLSGC